MRIVVLGAGLAGVTTAWRLVQDGHEVTLIDRAARVADAASETNGGIVSASRAFPWASPQMHKTFLRALTRNDQAVRVMLMRWDPAFWAWGLRFLAACRPERYAEILDRKVRFVRYAQEELALLAAESGVQFHRRQEGVLYLYRNSAALEAGDRKLDPMRRLGFEFRVLDRAALLRAEPSLAASADKLAGAVLSVSDESGESGLFCRELAALAQARGLMVRTGCEVRRIDVEGTRVTGVHTSTGRIVADAYVCALGVIAPQLARQLGADLPIYPVRGYSATVPMQRPERAPTRAGIDETRLIAWCPMGDRLRITGGAEFAGWGRKSRLADYTRLFDLAEDLFPGLIDRVRGPVNSALSVCQRPMTPESTPLFGTGRYENLWFNVGLGHMGWTMAAGAARITADLIAGRYPAILLDGLRIKAR